MSDKEVRNETEVQETNVSVEVKEGFGTKIKNGAKKVFSSKPAKIIGGVLLTAGGVAVGYSFGRRNTIDGALDEALGDDDWEVESEIVEDESQIAD